MRFTPIGELIGIEDFAFECSFNFKCGADRIKVADIAGYRINRARAA